MQTIKKTYQVYSFDELSEDAKQKAIETLCDINTEYGWWGDTYDDAKKIGLELGDFDMDSASFVRNLEGQFTLVAHEVAANIIRDYGEQCDTYKTAQSFLDTVNEIQGKYEELGGQNYEDEMIQAEENFLAELLIDYTKALQIEIEYLGSKETIIDTIKANDYQFTEDGKLF